eukprot:GSChrysophyteH1.ASY1.ANO1.337.1 assembled CDS
MPTATKRHDKDKYYHLAKDQGYRARSAFKLIQINKRFDFLSAARVCIDLCAAPGGWCQVAAQLMPKGSLILGVDLLPIRAIRGVKTLVNDITTAECRRNIVEELNGWSADVVLCDGAPNIGSSYHKDAFVQNELVLAALKTATDHLVKGGTFCTKVYRSTDYNALIWAFQQLFEDVQAIKPNSSRAQSAEIFIVCMKYTKPDKVDPKFVDPNHIFRARHRSGYEWDNGLLTSNATVTDFIASADPVRVLTDVNTLSFTADCEKYKSNRYTTDEIVECLKDLRVLGKTDFKKILKWRQRLRDWDEMEKKDTNDEPNESTRRSADEPEEETEETIYEQILEMRAKVAQEERRVKKKAREMASKERSRQALGMTANVFDGAQEDAEIFSFSKSNKGRQLIEDALEKYGDDADILESSGDDSDAERAKRNAPQTLKESKRKLLEEEKKQYEDLLTKGSQPETGSRKQARRDKRNQTANADSSDSSDSDTEESDGSIEGDDDDVASMMSTSDDDTSRSEQWFSHPIFRESLLEVEEQQSDEDSDNDMRISKSAQEMIDSMPKTDKQKRAEKRKKEQERAARKAAKRARNDANASIEDAYFPNSKKKKKLSKGGDVGNESDDGSHDDDLLQNAMRKAPEIRKGMGKMLKDESGFEILRMDAKDYNSDDEEYTANERAEQLALGTLMLRRSRRKALVDASYNRFTYNDPDDLPSWFQDDELKHNKPQIPIPPALLEQIKTKFQMTGTKSIKKVAEAQMRKKKRAQTKLKAAKKQANSLAENKEMSEKEKLKAIQRAMKNSKADKPSKVYVVGSKTKSGSSATRMSAGKGKLKFVDKRMKSDKRGEKKAAKKKGGHGRGKK